MVRGRLAYTVDEIVYFYSEKADRMTRWDRFCFVWFLIGLCLDYEDRGD